VTGGAGTSGLAGSNSGGTTTFKRIGSAANGASALGGFCKLVVDATVNQVTYKRSDTGADYSLSNDYPAVADVRDGTVYKLGALEGELAAGGGPVRILPLMGSVG
jgi:hypothetical protein